MKKVICIGECALDIVFRSAEPLGSMPGGRIVNSATYLASRGLPVKLVSELAVGSVGDIISDFLVAAGVDCSSVDRFTEGLTPVVIYTLAGEAVSDITRYERYPGECFDVVWPRIDEGDIVLFGGFYALDDRMRPRMLQLLEHAAERKAVLVYLPGFLPQQQPRITRVMPALLENIELASLVITRGNDLAMIFGNSDAAACYRNHVDFYCHSLINVDAAARRVDYYSGKESSSVEIGSSLCDTLIWNSAAVGSIVESLYNADEVIAALDAPSDGFRRDILRKAVSEADREAEALTEEWKKLH